MHDRDQATAALAFAREHGLAILLTSPPGAAARAGVLYFRALEELVQAPVLVDCGADAGLVLAGLRMGLRQLLFTGPPPLRRRLREIAGLQAALVHARLGPRRVLLEPGEDAARRLRFHAAGGYPAPPLPPSSQGGSRV
ncbi:hypothetical protein SH611_07840 [Geminicoccaceae bacterium 1502E]|nr:hypothetical protein [Geminicoccaceae bacterium 1502E]